MEQRRENNLSEEGQQLAEIERNLEEYLQQEILQMQNMQNAPAMDQTRPRQGGSLNFVDPEKHSTIDIEGIGAVPYADTVVSDEINSFSRYGSAKDAQETKTPEAKIQEQRIPEAKIQEQRIQEEKNPEMKVTEQKISEKWTSEQKIQKQKNQEQRTSEREISGKKNVLKDLLLQGASAVSTDFSDSEDEFIDWDAKNVSPKPGAKFVQKTDEISQTNQSQKSKSQNGKSQNGKVQNVVNGGNVSNKPKKRKTGFGAFLITLLIVVLVVFGLWYCVVRSVYSNMNYKPLDGLVSAPLKEDGVINILLIGTDDREGVDGSRSDAMILLSISENTKTIYITSLLRDMYVEIPGHDGNRLNAAYAFGGPELLMETIENNFDITVNDYTEVDFMAFVSLVDAVGGVDIDLTVEEKGLVNAYLNEYNEITGQEAGTGYIDSTSSGLVHLGGAQALAYCRNRYIGSDFGRTERQRKVLSEALSKLPKALLRNPGILTDKLLPNLTTNLTSMEAYRLSFTVPSLLTYEIKQTSLPINGSYKDATIRSMAVLEVDFEENKKYIQKEIYGK